MYLHRSSATAGNSRTVKKTKKAADVIMNMMSVVLHSYTCGHLPRQSTSLSWTTIDISSRTTITHLGSLQPSIERLVERTDHRPRIVVTRSRCHSHPPRPIDAQRSTDWTSPPLQLLVRSSSDECIGDRAFCRVAAAATAGTSEHEVMSALRSALLLPISVRYYISKHWHQPDILFNNRLCRVVISFVNKECASPYVLTYSHGI